MRKDANTGRHRALFLGATGAFSALPLNIWLDAGHEVAEYWYSARGGALALRRDARLSWACPRFSVTATLRRRGISSRAVPRLANWPEVVEVARATGADVLICTAFMNLVPPSLLDLFPNRAFNLHPGLLPAYRGPTPITSMAYDEALDSHGGVTLHLMSNGFDEGDIIAQKRVPFPPTRDLQRFELAVATTGAELLSSDLQSFLSGEMVPRPQEEHLATYRRFDMSHSILRPDFAAERIRWLCDTLGWRMPLRVEGLEGQPVRWFDTVIGPISGQPPEVGHRTVTFDAADARVRLRRDSSFMSKKVRWRRRILRVLAAHSR